MVKPLLIIEKNEVVSVAGRWEPPGGGLLLGFGGLLLVNGEDLLDTGQGVAPEGLLDLAVLVAELGLVEDAVELLELVLAAHGLNRLAGLGLGELEVGAHAVAGPVAGRFASGPAQGGHRQGLAEAAWT